MTAGNHINLNENPMSGMNLCFLGSSVTLGTDPCNISFVEYLSRRNSFTFTKSAVSGTTMVDCGIDSYVQRIREIDKNSKFDTFICQLSTNDATQNKILGKISDSYSLYDFDVTTITGAAEYIICYAKLTWECPVIFYTGTRFDNDLYEIMINVLYKLQKKWGIGIIDLWNDIGLNDITEEQRSLYMYDPIHPTEAGYLEWWLPAIEKYLYNYYRMSR